MLNSTASKKITGWRNPILLLIAVVIIKMLGQYFAIHPAFDLQRDEYLHLDQANHLAWGYQSVPPFTSWISLLIRWLGNDVFWVKFFPALFGAATIVSAYYIVTALNGGPFAKSLTLIALLFSVLFRINILFQPNSFDILCWTLLYLFLIKYIGTQQTRWLWWIAVTFAFGFLNKYSILFLVLAIAAALLATSERKIFAKPHLYFSVAVALILISPNLIWQYQQGFPVIHHMKELAATQLVHVKRSDFLRAQFFFFFQAIFILLAAMAGFIFYPPFKKYRTIIWSYIFCILLFLYFRAKDYYALGLYPVLIAFGAVYLETLLQNGWKKYLRPVCFLLVIILFYPYVIRLPIVSPEDMMTKTPFNKTGPHIWEDGREHPLSQDFADMLGWKELAHKTDSIYKTFPSTEHTIIICDNYGQAGAINFYAGLSAVSFNADYINWFKLEKPINNLILVKEFADKDISRTREKKLFGSILLADSITNAFAREKGTRIFVGKAPLVPVNEVLKKVIEQVKKGEFK